LAGAPPGGRRRARRAPARAAVPDRRLARPLRRLRGDAPLRALLARRRRALPCPRRRRPRVDGRRPESPANPLRNRGRRYHHERPADLRSRTYMKRWGLVIALLAGCLAMGVLAAMVASGATRPWDTTTGSIATTASEPTITLTTTDSMTTVEQPIAAGVKIGGVPVGGLTPTRAY